MDTVSAAYTLVMYFRNGDLGWDEALHLKATSYATARTAAAKLISFRLSLSPETVELVYASIRKQGKPRDGLPVVMSYPAAGTASVIVSAVAEDVNAPSDAFYARLAAVDGADETERAFSVTMTVRGIPDDCVTGRRITLPDGSPIVVTIPASEPASVGTPADYAAAIGNYLKVVMGQTRYTDRIDDTGDTPPVPQFNVADWTEVVFRGYTSRKCGAPFTLEPGRDASA